MFLYASISGDIGDTPYIFGTRQTAICMFVTSIGTTAS